MQEKKRILTSFKKVFTGLNNLFWKTFKHIKSAPTSKCVFTPEKPFGLPVVSGQKADLIFFVWCSLYSRCPFELYFEKDTEACDVWCYHWTEMTSGTLSKSPEMEDYMEFLHAVFLLCIFVLLLELQNNSESQEQPIQYRYCNAVF